MRTWLAIALIALLGASARAALPPPPPGMVATNGRTVSCARTMPRFDVTGSSHGGPLGRYVASHFALWTQGGGRQLAVGEIRATGRAWLRVATSCRLRYSR